MGITDLFISIDLAQRIYIIFNKNSSCKSYSNCILNPQIILYKSQRQLQTDMYITSQKSQQKCQLGHPVTCMNIPVIACYRSACSQSADLSTTPLILKHDCNANSRLPEISATSVLRLNCCNVPIVIKLLHPAVFLPGTNNSSLLIIVYIEPGQCQIQPVNIFC